MYLQEQRELLELIANNHMHSDSKKRCGFRYAPVTPLFAAGDVSRWPRNDKAVKYCARGGVIFMYVFISYSHVDKELVTELSAVIDRLQIDYFLDQKDINWGDSISSEIESGFVKVTHIVLVLSPASLKSSWVSYETGIAKGRGLKILPLLTHPSLDLPGYLANTSYKTSVGDMETYFRTVERTANHLPVQLQLAVGHLVGQYASPDQEFPDGTAFLGTKSMDKDYDQADRCIPALGLKIVHIGDRPISLKWPMISLGEGAEHSQVSFAMSRPGRMQAALRPGEAKDFSFYGSELFSKQIIQYGIESVYVEDVLGRKTVADPAEVTKASEYYRKFFRVETIGELCVAFREYRDSRST